MGIFFRVSNGVYAKQWDPVPIDGDNGLFWCNATHPSMGKQLKAMEHTHIITSRGVLDVLPGDWIVTEVPGEHFVYSPEDFEKYFGINQKESLK